MTTPDFYRQQIPVDEVLPSEDEVVDRFHTRANLYRSCGLGDFKVVCWQGTLQIAVLGHLSYYETNLGLIKLKVALPTMIASFSWL